MSDSEPKTFSYKHPPVTEAVIGINFVSPINESDIASVIKKFQTIYSGYHTVKNWDMAVRMTNDEGSKPTADLNHTVGHRFSTSDMSQLLLLWPNSISISQLSPYEGWDHFFDRFVRDWRAIKRLLGFQQIARLGVRYINRVDIPAKGPIVEHEEFLNVYPKMPDFLSPMQAYAVQAVVQLDDIGCQLNINSASVPSPILNHSSFVVDLDIVKEISPPQSDNDIYEMLNKIRVRKNAIFEACISNNARELFK